MDKQKHIALSAVVVLLLLAVILSLGLTYARYRTEIVGDLAFSAKPLEQLTLSGQSWKTTDGADVLTFSLEQSAENVRLYLAVSEGVAVSDAVTVSLTLPSAEEGGEDVVVQAAAQKIEEGSALHTLFGAGYVFRFTDEVSGQELLQDLQADTAYVLTVTGLDTAVEHTSLLRLFIERTQY